MSSNTRRTRSQSSTQRQSGSGNRGGASNRSAGNNNNNRGGNRNRSRSRSRSNSGRRRNNSRNNEEVQGGGHSRGRAYESASDSELDDGMTTKIGRDLLDTDSENEGMIPGVLRDLLGKPAIRKMRTAAEKRSLERRERRRIQREIERQRDEEELQQAIRRKKINALRQEYDQFC